MHDLIWRTKNGRLIPVSQMTTNHIYNAIALIERSPGWRVEYLDRLRLELEIRNMEDRL